MMPLMMLTAAALVAGRWLEPWTRISALAVGVHTGCKWLTWHGQPFGARGLPVGYLLAWPAWTRRQSQRRVNVQSKRPGRRAWWRSSGRSPSNAQDTGDHARAATGREVFRSSEIERTNYRQFRECLIEQTPPIESLGHTLRKTRLRPADTAILDSLVHSDAALGDAVSVQDAPHHFSQALFDRRLTCTCGVNGVAHMHGRFCK